MRVGLPAEYLREHADIIEHAPRKPSEAREKNRAAAEEWLPWLLRVERVAAEDSLMHAIFTAAAFLIVAATCVVTVARYDALPDRVPLGLHFNADSAGNGPRYMIWFFPFVQLGLALDAFAQPARDAVFLAAIVAIVYFAQVLAIELSLYGPSRIRYVRFWASFAILIALGTSGAFALPLH